MDIATWDLITISTYFVLAMLTFFEPGRNRRIWLSALFLGVFCVQAIVTLISAKPTTTKLFTALLFVSMVTVVSVILFREQKKPGRQR